VNSVGIYINQRCFLVLTLLLYEGPRKSRKGLKCLLLDECLYQMEEKRLKCQSLPLTLRSLTFTQNMLINNDTALG